MCTTRIVYARFLSYQLATGDVLSMHSNIHSFWAVALLFSVVAVVSSKPRVVVDMAAHCVDLPHRHGQVGHRVTYGPHGIRRPTVRQPLSDRDCP